MDAYHFVNDLPEGTECNHAGIDLDDALSVLHDFPADDVKFLFGYIIFSQESSHFRGFRKIENSLDYSTFGFKPYIIPRSPFSVQIADRFNNHGFSRP